MSTVLELLPGIFFVLLFLGGIRLMSSPRTAQMGNLLGAIGVLSAVLYTLFAAGIVDMTGILIPVGIGAVIGYFLAVRVSMIQMPQLVALLNGLGGGASAATALAALGSGVASVFTASLALLVGGVTLGGSLLAAAKLARLLPQKPTMLRYHSFINVAMMVCLGVLIAGMVFWGQSAMLASAAVLLAVSIAFGVVFTVRIGGADMPITISLLNSLSGLAGSVAGIAIGEPILVGTGAIVGSAGLILTQVMCRAMNRSLQDILLGRTSVSTQSSPSNISAEVISTEVTEAGEHNNPLEKLTDAKTVFFVPGYGMALSQAQHRVKEFGDLLERQGKDVKFAIHPVAGRMPGHMYVLLAEAGVPYEKLLEIDSANPLLADTDVVIVVGANDVVNPSATSAEGTPIYGMPILNVSDARHIIIFNMDTNPGYAGVDNPLYVSKKATLMTGDASERIGEFMTEYTEKS